MDRVVRWEPGAVDAGSVSDGLLQIRMVVLCDSVEAKQGCE